MHTMITSFGNSTLTIRVKFPKLAIMNRPRALGEIISFDGARGRNGSNPHARPVRGARHRYMELPGDPRHRNPAAAS